MVCFNTYDSTKHSDCHFNAEGLWVSLLILVPVQQKKKKKKAFLFALFPTHMKQPYLETQDELLIHMSSLYICWLNWYVDLTEDGIREVYMPEPYCAYNASCNYIFADPLALCCVQTLSTRLQPLLQSTMERAYAFLIFFFIQKGSSLGDKVGE